MNVIEFPGLWGLKFSISPIALHLGPVSIYWYGIIIAAAFMLAVLLAMKNSSKFGIESENIIDLVLFAAPVSIIFARAYYVAFSWDKYRDDLSEVYKIWHGGIAIYGAVLGAILTAYLYARYKKIDPLNLFDLGAPYLLLAQAIGRWGNFVNQEAFGTNTKLPWGMTSERIRNDLTLMQMQGQNVDPSIPVHPTFLYESLWNLGAFFVLIWFTKKKKVTGEIFFLYMILYGLGRSWIEGLRTDSLMLGNVRVSQLLAIVFVIAFAIVFYVRRKKAAEAVTEDVEIGMSRYGDLVKQMKEENVVAAEEAVPGNTDENANEEKEAGDNEQIQEQAVDEGEEKVE